MEVQIIRTEINPVINTIIEKYCIQDWFREYDPIIAGGSILYFYLNFGDIRSPSCRQITSQIEMSDKALRAAKNHTSSTPRTVPSPIADYSGDVDVWFSDQETLDIVSAKAAFSASESKNSNWASTYSISNQRVFRKMNVLQIMKKVYKSPEDLISSFDLANSMIAWKNGVIYIDSRLDDAFERGSLEYVNNPFKEKISIASKLFNALRLFKYAKRYHLSFSDDINKDILQLYLDVDDLDILEYGNKVQYIKSHYGKTRSSPDSVNNMIISLSMNIDFWYYMSTFKEHDIAYLVGLKSDKLNNVKNFVKKILGAETSSIPF